MAVRSSNSRHFATLSGHEPGIAQGCARMHGMFRLTSVGMAAALLSAQVARPALAQAVPPPVSQPAGVEQQTGDPPSRVGRLAQVSGTVSFHAQGDTQWRRATLNYPVAQGYTLWTEPNAQAVIEVSASRVAMAPGTELDVATLTDTAFQATVPQGELYLRLSAARPEEIYAVQTPRGLVTLSAPGRYGVVPGTTQDPTVVTVVEGAAHVEGPGVALDIGPSQAARITGSDAFQAEVVPAQHDAFLTAMLNSERRPQGATPSVAAAMPGGEDLAQYGYWDASPVYGQVWYPQVPPDWAPYREGSWAYVPPWGWTWVDSEPWGFAPFHYGRWVQIGGRWAWIPGAEAAAPAPIYAPALVTFFGIGALAGAGIGAALAEGHIGWVPLGPREPFRPWFHASDRYLQRVNLGRPGPELAVGRFANVHAATMVPSGTMTASRPVPGAFLRPDPAQLAQVRPLAGQHSLPPPGIHPAAPGPAIRGVSAAPTALPMLPAAVGAVRPFSGPPALRAPAAPGQIGPPMIHQQSGLTGPPAVPHMPSLAGPTIVHPPAPYHAPGAVFRQPPPPAAFHPVAPAVVHPTPPAAFHPPAPPAVVHAAPRPPPQFHPTASPPVAHAPPPAQNAQHKRPGEP